MEARFEAAMTLQGIQGSTRIAKATPIAATLIVTEVWTAPEKGPKQGSCVMESISAFRLVFNHASPVSWGGSTQDFDL